MVRLILRPGPELACMLYKNLRLILSMRVSAVFLLYGRCKKFLRLLRIFSNWRFLVDCTEIFIETQRDHNGGFLESIYKQTGSICNFPQNASRRLHSQIIFTIDNDRKLFQVRNKNCATSPRALRHNTTPPEHNCFKNWHGSSYWQWNRE